MPIRHSAPLLGGKALTLADVDGHLAEWRTVLLDAPDDRRRREARRCLDAWLELRRTMTHPAQ